MEDENIDNPLGAFLEKLRSIGLFWILMLFALGLFTGLVIKRSPIPNNRVSVRLPIGAHAWGEGNMVVIGVLPGYEIRKLDGDKTRDIK